MRMRTLGHVILACLFLASLTAPTASAHERNGRGNGYGHDRNHGDRDHGRHKDRHKDRDGGGRRSGQLSFFGAAGQADCSKETMSCDYVFSRSTTAELHERLTWLLEEHQDGIERIAGRLCRRAELSKECTGNFIAGLYNGIDAMEIALVESSCASLHLAWSKREGLSQAWTTTNDEKCTD